jgi:GNAT superfamily N-acetyltransferase
MMPKRARQEKPTAPRIRKARAADAKRIAELSAELGYPATAAEVATRLRKLAFGSPNALLVADSPSVGIIGWTHVSITYLVEIGTRAELNALIVSESARNQGAGAALLAAAETWARRHGCPSMSVRSNVLRERAHSFYLRQGYEHYKTQKAFRKALPSTKRRS